MPIRHAADYVEKRLSPRERGEVEAVARLRAEAALLDHLGATGVTPRLLARGEDDGGPWHRIERVALPTLADHIERAGERPLDRAFMERAARAAFDALAKIHEASDPRGHLAILHADLSPANVAIDATGARVVVLDFDLACFRDSPPRDGAFRGTIAYTAPEIARGESPTVRSDLFSLAATLLHGITGRPPRSGPSFAALLAIAGESPLLSPEHAALAAHGPGHAAVIACLAHEPVRRPPSANAALSGWPLVERSPGS